jgi:PncC family amidohydrolase
MLESKKLEISSLSKELVRLAADKKITFSLAESCTGGKIAAAITDIPGSSKAFIAGIVSYSAQSKVDLLGVNSEMIRKQGAVSEEVAISMALGIKHRTYCDVALAVSGVAGPTADDYQRPVGLIYIGVATNDHRGEELVSGHIYHFKGNREEVRAQATREALEILIHTVESYKRYK